MLRTQVKQLSSLALRLALLCACAPQTHSPDVLLPGELVYFPQLRSLYGFIRDWL